MKKKQFMKMTALLVWLLISALVLASLGAHHYLAWSPFVENIEGTGHWKATHVLANDCGCSKIVAQSLLQRKQASDVDQEILWIGPKTTLFEQLQSRYPIRVIAADTLNELAGGVPTLVVTNPQNNIIYAGGYSAEKIQSVDQVQDQNIVASLQGREPVRTFPIFGCAVSQKMRSLIDPYNIKYSQKGEP